MSRIGKNPISIPSGVSVELKGTVLHVKGPKGELTRDTEGRISLAVEDNTAVVGLANEQVGRNFWGLYRTLLSNMVEGVSKGYRRALKLEGTGYRATVKGKGLTLNVGYSNPVELDEIPGITFDVTKDGMVGVSGIDKELVGRIAAEIRAVRPPEPYHGKGIRYEGEVIQLKAGKSAAKK